MTIGHPTLRSNTSLSTRLSQHVSLNTMHPYMRATLTLAFSAAVLPCAAGAQSRPPIRQLGPVQSASKDSLGLATNIRALPGGRLLINDVSSRRVLLVDSTFTLVSIVADSTSTTANAYGPRSGSLIAYRGDSTLFVDAASLTMLVEEGTQSILLTGVM